MRLMSVSTPERRQIENEMIFRRANETVSEGLDELDADHVADGNPQLAQDEDMTLHFICECSDEDCMERIPIKLRTYQTIHEDRDAFIVKPTHEVEIIEKVVAEEAEYSVVKKNKTAVYPREGLNQTAIDNS